ncbi:MAG: hypothetical protein LKG34_07415 [Acetobacter sp.]|nr:hypothetical protein [Acetobacter sp.]MCI1442201.1 hypothetical protein [Acetobacter sp.]
MSDMTGRASADCPDQAADAELRGRFQCDRHSADGEASCIPEHSTAGTGRDACGEPLPMPHHILSSALIRASDHNPCASGLVIFSMMERRQEVSPALRNPSQP